MSKSNYLEQALLNWLKGTTFPAAPSDVYIALYTADPTDAGDGTEVSGGSYARAEFDVEDWSTISDDNGTSVISNDEPVAFPTATADWGEVTHFGVLDASTSGNLLWHGALDTSREIKNGDPTPTFAANALTIGEQ